MSCSLLMWCWFIGSLGRWFIGSLDRDFVGSLVHWFVGSLDRGFVGSWVRRWVASGCARGVWDIPSSSSPPTRYPPLKITTYPHEVVSRASSLVHCLVVGRYPRSVESPSRNRRPTSPRVRRHGATHRRTERGPVDLSLWSPISFWEVDTVDVSRRSPTDTTSDAEPSRRTSRRGVGGGMAPASRPAVAVAGGGVGVGGERARGGPRARMDDPPVRHSMQYITIRPER